MGEWQTIPEELSMFCGHPVEWRFTGGERGVTAAVPKQTIEAWGETPEAAYMALHKAFERHVDPFGARAMHAALKRIRDTRPHDDELQRIVRPALDGSPLP